VKISRPPAGTSAAVSHRFRLAPMTRTCRTLLLGAAAALSTPLAAQQDSRTAAQSCLDEAHTQSDMTACAVRERVSADSALNRAYQSLMPTLEPERRELLRAAQRAWIVFRDTHCAFEESEFSGGSLAPMIESLCVARLTRERTRELEPDEAQPGRD
jgi:uncharacterized protein YecT (DUF1311 family)